MQMVIKRFNLDWSRDQHGNYRVEDPVIKSFYVGSNRPDRSGVYTDRKLDVAVQAAVSARKSHDDEMTKRSGFSTAPVEIGGKKPGDKVITVASPRKRPTRQQQRNELRALVNGKKVAAATAPTPVVTAPVVTAPVAHKPRVLIDDSPIEADIEIEIDADDLDNTGSRERSRLDRREPKRSKKESMFLTTARVLVKNPNIGQESLAVQGKVAQSTAKQCQVAWRDILVTLDAAGCLTAAGKRLIPTRRGAAQ